MPYPIDDNMSALYFINIPLSLSDINTKKYHFCDSKEPYFL